jgi:hypothetical protein
MLGRALDAEILRRPARPLELGPDPRIARLQRAIGQAGPIAPDGIVEALSPPRVDAIIQILDPFHIRPEPRPTGEIEGEMNAQPRRLGHGIDQMAKGGAGPEDEVVPLGEMARGHQSGIEALQRACHGLGLQAGGVHEIAAMERQRRVAAYLKAESVIGDTTARQRAPQGQHRARRLRIALEGQHQPMAVDDAGGGRQQRPNRSQIRLQGVDRGRIEPGEIIHAIGRRLPPQRRQRRKLVFPAGDDQLA